MKTVATLFFVLFGFYVSSQNYQLTKTYDFAINDSIADDIFKIDSKPNSIFLLKRLYTPNGEPYMQYFLFESINGSEFEPIEIPSVNHIVSKAAISSHGILFRAIIDEMGEELVYFDGIQGHVFDLNLGLNGSYPTCYSVNDRLFFTCLVSDVFPIQELFEFNDVADFDQISNGSFGQIDYINLVTDDFIIYTFSDMGGGKVLKKSTYNGTSWSVEDLRAVTDETTSWSEVVELNDKLLCYELESISGSMAMTYKLLVFDEENNVSVLFQTSGDFSYPLEIFNHQDLVYFQVISNGSLFSTSDGTSYSIILPPADGRLIKHIVKDDILYFIVSKSGNVSDVDHLLKRVNNQNITVYPGNSLTLVNAKMDDFFLIEGFFELTQGSELLKISSDGSMNTWSFNAPNGQYHENPFYHQNNSVYQNNKLHVLFTEWADNGAPYYINTDIYTLQSTAGLFNIESSNFSLYPNPVNSGNSIMISTEEFGGYAILNTLGAEIQTGKIFSSQQVIELETLSSGIYFFNFNNSVHKFVVN